MRKGILLKGVGSFYTVCSFEDDKEYVLKARGIFRKDEITPCVGDIVWFEAENENSEGTIEKIENRKNFLVRPPIANIDQMIIVASLKSPDINYIVLDKMIVNALKQNIKIMLCFNKLDLVDKGLTDRIKKCYEKSGFEIFFISVKNKFGTEELKSHLSGKVTAFAGLSGVGKSSLINEIIPGAEMETGQVSEKVKRGKHTTRHLELFRYGKDGFVADTPGFSSLSLFDIEYGDLWKYYPEFYNFSDCRFATCMHINEPGCNVKKAVEAGEINELRYSNYLKLLEELRKERVRK